MLVLTGIVLTVLAIAFPKVTHILLIVVVVGGLAIAALLVVTGVPAHL